MLRTQDPQDPLAPLTESVALPALPRSVLLHNFGSGRSSKEEDFQPHVLAGLTDGSVVALSFKNNELKDQKVFSLGTAPVSLSVCEVDGKRTVFASGSRSAVFFWDKQRLRQSPVMLKVRFVTPRKCIAHVSTHRMSRWDLPSIQPTSHHAKFLLRRLRW